MQLTAHPNEALQPSARLLLRMTPGLQDRRKASWKLSPGGRKSKNIASHDVTNSVYSRLSSSCCAAFFGVAAVSMPILRLWFIIIIIIFNRESIVRNSDTIFFCEGGVKILNPWKRKAHCSPEQWQHPFFASLLRSLCKTIELNIIIDLLDVQLKT